MTDNIIKLDTYTPTPKQARAHTCPFKYLLYGGGLGGGKSRCICEDAVINMIEFPGNHGFIGRAIFSDFDITTYVELSSVLEPYIEAGYVIENKTKHYYKFNNGSQLWYGGLERDTGKGAGLGKKNKLFSAEFGWIGFDQAEELTEDQFEKVASRLRRVLPNGKEPHYRCMLTANPAQNWIKRRFILAPDKDSVFITALASDNPHLSKDYVEGLKTLFKGSKDYLEALIYGSWDSISAIDDLIKMSEVNACLKDFGKDKNGLPCSPLVRFYNHRVISVDPAYFGNDSTVIYGWENEFPMHKIKYDKKDPEYTVGQLLMLEKRMGGNCLFVIDDTGGYGSGIVAALRSTYHEDTDEEGYNPRIMAINFASKADDDVHYANQRAELYFEAAEDIKSHHCAIPRSEIELQGQLCAHKYTFQRGRILIQSKELVKKVLNESPDESDSFVLGLKGVRALVNKLRVLTPAWTSQKPAWQQVREEKIIERGHINQDQDLFIA